MSPGEKYVKVLAVKRLKVYRAEEILGFGRNTLKNAIEGNRQLSEKYHHDFMEKFHVKHEWWETGNGDIFEEKLTGVSEPAATYGSTEAYIQSLKDHIATLKEQLKLLGKIIDER